MRTASRTSRRTARTLLAACLAGGVLTTVAAREARAQQPAPAPAPAPTPTPATGTTGDTLAIAVTEKTEVPMKLRGFYERRAAKRGHFIDRQQLDASTGKRLSEVIRDLPGVRLLPSSNSSVTAVRFRGCQPLVWVDAVRNVGDELDAAIALGDVEAMEVYIAPGTVPAQFRDMRQPCGAVIVWTR